MLLVGAVVSAFLSVIALFFLIIFSRLNVEANPSKGMLSSVTSKCRLQI